MVAEDRAQDAARDGPITPMTMAARKKMDIIASSRA